MNSLKKYLPDEETYQRIKDSKPNGFIDYSYDHFMQFNKDCINKLSEDMLTWILKLCTHIHEDCITLMDTETAAQFKACGIFFNAERKLCIWNPR